MYYLPIWFLVLGLFLPRIALFVEWTNDCPLPFYQPWAGLTWLILPRVMILIMIATVQGLSAWFWLHLGALFLCLLGTAANSD